MILEHLIEFGLSEKEALVYVSLLELGTAPVQTIAKRAQINRSTAYVVLDMLKEKGLVSISDVNKVRQYNAVSPEMLAQIAERLANKQEEIRKKIHTVLPGLKAIYKDSKNKPTVRIFEGKEGIKRVYEDALTISKGSVIRALSQPEVWNNIEKDYFNYLKDERIKKGIYLKSIYPDSARKTGTIKNKPPKEHLVSLKFLKKDHSPFSSDFRIYENKVALTSLKDNLGIIIENKEISDAIQHIFDIAWENLKE